MGRSGGEAEIDVHDESQIPGSGQNLTVPRPTQREREPSLSFRSALGCTRRSEGWPGSDAHIRKADQVFGFFKKRKSAAADAAAGTVPGDDRSTRNVDLEHAVTLAYEELLFEQIPRQEVEGLAASLADGPMARSTHDLAVSTALMVFSTSRNIKKLSRVQLAARACVLNWLKAGQVTPQIAWTFESALYLDYKPTVSAEADP